VSDLSSSSNISAANAGPSVSNLEIAGKYSNTARNQQVSEQKSSIVPENSTKTASSDSFKAVNTNPAPGSQQLPAASKPTSNTNLKQLMTSVNTLQAGTLSQLTNFMSRFVNIMDKISAVFGEKETLLRERLSDTFKKQKTKEYIPFDKIDASMEQQDHHKEKKTRDENKKPPEQEANSQTFRID